MSSKNKLNDFRVTYSTILVIVFISCLAVGVTGLVLSSLLFSKISTNNSTICDNCNGIISTVYTDDGVLSPVVDQSLKLFGISGIKTSISGIDEITVNNLRDLTPYTVNADGGSEYLTPQEAYLAAVADGKGGIGLPAVIIISPGTYDFGDTQFEINQPGISWVALPSLPGISAGVVFTASGPNGGLLVSIPFDPIKLAIFQGITFGETNSDIGFLINNTQGQCALVSCGSLNSNFRIIMGGNSSYTVMSILSSTFKTIPNNDFITTVDPFTILILEGCNIFQLITGAIPIFPGGHVFNFQNGVLLVRIFNTFIHIDHYDGVFKGPLSGVTNDGLIEFQRSTVLVAGSLTPYFFKQSGHMNLRVSSSILDIYGPLIYQNEDCLSGETHLLFFAENKLTSNNASILIESNVTVIGNNDYQLYNSFINVLIDPYIINIPTATGSDTVDVILAGTTIKTTAAPFGDYALGPGLLFGNIRVGGSFCINGATTANAFTYIPLTPI